MRTVATIIILIASWLTTVTPVSAEIPTVYTNENFFTSEHDAPVSLYRADDGAFFGQTVTGKWYRQSTIANAYDIRLMRFTIDEAYFYVSDRGIIFSDSDLAALAIYLTLG